MQFLELLKDFWLVFLPVFLTFAVVQTCMTLGSRATWWIVVPSAAILQFLLVCLYLAIPFDLPRFEVGLAGLNADQATLVVVSFAAGAAVTLIVRVGRDWD